MSKVIVLGAGIAGSTTALLIGNGGRVPPITVYDASNIYLKPCGEAVPVELLDIVSDQGLPAPRVVEYVGCFKIGVPGRVERIIEFDEQLWAIIDKALWVEALRKEVERDGIETRYGITLPYNPVVRSEFVVVDARGPFSSRGLKIPVWRAYAPRSLLKRSDCNGAHIYFTLRPRVGLVWVFPYGNKVNLGGGFIGSRSPRRESLEILSQVIAVEGLASLTMKESHAMLTILPKPRLWDGRRVYVGEAAGLVLSLGGEGIRPAVLSAIALAESFRSGRVDFGLYSEKNRSLVETVRAQALLLKVAAAISSEEVLSRLFEGAPNSLMRKWFSGGIGPREAIEVVKLILASLSDTHIIGVTAPPS